MPSPNLPKIPKWGGGGGVVDPLCNFCSRVQKWQYTVSQSPICRGGEGGYGIRKGFLMCEGHLDPGQGRLALGFFCSLLHKKKMNEELFCFQQVGIKCSLEFFRNELLGIWRFCRIFFVKRGFEPATSCIRNLWFIRFPDFAKFHFHFWKNRNDEVLIPCNFCVHFSFKNLPFPNKIGKMVWVWFTKLFWSFANCSYFN